MPPASRTLRLLAFAVPAALAASAVQPLLASAAGVVRVDWALRLALPALGVAAVIVLADRLSDRRLGEPPWYAAWALLPGSFLLAGAASMCLFGSFIELPAARLACWGLLGSGAVSWAAGLLLVRRESA